MEITDSFRVSTPIDATWKVMLDIEGIAPCLPGAQLQEVEGDEYRGVVKVKVGPITAQYKGAARLTEIDESNHRIVIDASGRDTRGQGNAKATIVVTMAAEGAGTKVDVATDLSITGKVAQFGRGVLADVSSKLMGQFVDNIERDVLTTAGGGDTSHAGGPYEQALESVPGIAHNGHAGPPVSPATTGPRRIDSPEAEPVDLFGVAGAPLTKRLVPIGIAALVLFVLWRVLRRG
jgi:carbon monoxide dehydrogenase subunit G